MVSGAFWFREGRPEDLGAVAEIWLEDAIATSRVDARLAPNDNGKQDYLASLEDQLASDESLLLVAGEEESIAGFCLASVVEWPDYFKRNRIGYLWNLIVREASRRKGIGSRLFEEALTWCRSMKVCSIQYGAPIKEPSVREFLERRGFEPLAIYECLDI